MKQIQPGKRCGVGQMLTGCALISVVALAAFAYLMALAQETIAMYEALLHPLATAIYLYCAGAFLPCAIAMALLLAVVCEIGKGSAFTLKNMRLLRGISWMAFAECAYIVGGVVGFSCAGVMHIGVVLLALLFVLLGSGVGLLARALSNLVRQASVIQQENDLTV